MAGDSTLPHYGFSVEIDGSCDAAFDLATDLRSLPARIRDIDAIAVLDSGPVRLGTRFTHARHVLGIPAKKLVTITDWQPPLRFVASFEVAGVVVDSIHLFEETATGCRFTLALSAEPDGALRHLKTLLWFALTPAIVRGVRREVRDMRLRVEHRGQQHASRPAPVSTTIPIVDSSS